MQLSIVIVNYNVKHFLEQCLCSVNAAIKKIDAEVIVVDNASSDGSLEFLQPLFPEVKFIQNKSNVGFSKACNQGFKLSKGEFILFLNPDTIVSEDCFEKCISFFKEKNDCGALGVRMIDGSGNFLAESKRSFPSPFISMFKLIGLASLFPRSPFFNKYALGNLKENKIYEIEVLAGAFIMTTKNILQTLNGFDETFFMYGEDIDLSYRIQQLGYKNYYLGTISILHFKGESSRRAGINYVKMFYSAMSVFVKKHYPKWQGFVFSFFIQLAIALRTIFFFSEKIFNLFLFVQKKSSEIILVIGSENQYQIFLSLLKNKNMEQNLFKRIDFNGEDERMNYYSIFNALFANQSINSIIFCEGDNISYNDIFLILQSVQSSKRFGFHSYNSKSIVSSHSKNMPGEAIG